MVVKICITEYNAAIIAISKHNSAIIIIIGVSIKDHLYRMVIVKGCCTMIRSSSFRSKLFIG